MPPGFRATVGWRALVPVTVAAAALLLVTSAITSHGSDLRSSSTLQVNQRIGLAEGDVTTLTRRVDALRAQISAATTGVRCVGNTLLLHGRVFGPPYVVTAIGDVDALARSLEADRDVQVLQQYVAAYGLRYRLTRLGHVTLPAYVGPLELTHAKAAP